MLCSIYKSLKKEETYLFIERKGDFSRVPETLLDLFGPSDLVMTFNLTPERKLAISDSRKVIEALTEQGFYLQLPPPKEDLLKQHRELFVNQNG